jgi:YVTN family beta-propeller protein
MSSPSSTGDGPRARGRARRRAGRRSWRRAWLPAALAAAALAPVGCGEEVPQYARDPFAGEPPRPGPMGGKLITTNFGDDSLSVLDPESRAVLWRVPVGFVPIELEGPHHLSVDPAGAFLYVNLSLSVPGAGSGPHGAHGTGAVKGFVLKLDAGDGRVVGQVQVDRNPGDNLLSPDGKTLYVTHYDLLSWLPAASMNRPRDGDSRLAIIDTATMAARFVTLCPAAHGLTLSADARTLYATCMPDQLAVLDVSRPDAQVQRIQLPQTSERASCAGCPYAMALAPDGRLFMGLLGAGNNANRGFVWLFDTATGAFDPEPALRLCGGALFPAFGPPTASMPASGYTVYFPEQGACDDAVRVLEVDAPGAAPRDAARIELPATACRNAHAVHLAAGGRTALVVCEGDHVGPGSVVWVDTAARAVLSSTTVGVFPDDLELMPPRR